MPRPIKPRTRQTLRRDVETLGRLRTAISLERELPKVLTTKILGRIDALVEALSEAIVMMK